MIQTSNPEIDVNKLMERVRRAAAKHRAQPAVAVVHAPPRVEQLLPEILDASAPPAVGLSKAPDDKREKLEDGVRKARGLIEATAKIPKLFRGLFRRQGGLNRALVDTVATLAKSNVQLTKRVHELMIIAEQQHDWMRSFATAGQTQTAWARAAAPLIATVAQQSEQLAQLNAKVADAVAEMSETQTMVADAHTSISEVRANVSDMRSSVSEVRSDVSEVKSGVSNLRAEIVEAQRRLSDTNQGLVALRGELQVLQEKSAHHSALLADLQGDNARASEHLRNLQATVDSAGEHLRNLQGTADQHAQRLATSESEIHTHAIDRAQLAAHVSRQDELGKAVTRLEERQANDAIYIKGELSRHSAMLQRPTATRRSAGAAVAHSSSEPPQTGADGRLDSFYLSFENRFRGQRAEIKLRVSFYLPLILDAEAGTSERPILDVGCGRGEWLELLAENGLHATGVDMNAAMVAQCNERQLAATVADAIAYLRSLPDDALGAVTGFHIIEHLPLETLIDLIQETRRALKPGGIVIFESPNCKNLTVGACNFNIDPTHRNPVFPETAEFMLETFGFDDVRLEYLSPAEGSPFDRKRRESAYFDERLFGPQDFACIGRKPSSG